MQWLLDTQLPPSFGKFLLSLGEDALHTTDYEDGHLLTDKSIRKIALDSNRIILSKDWDFYDDYFLLGAPPRIVHLQIGNCGNQELFFTWEKNHKQIINLLNEGCTLVILTKQKIIGY